MDNAKLFLLKRIAGYKKNGYNSFGGLHAKHVDDISNLMNEFVRETIKELLPLLNTGKSVQVFDDFAIQLKPSKRKTQTT
jgi:hypothetical protein